jgi:hypothetical protein
MIDKNKDCLSGGNGIGDLPYTGCQSRVDVTLAPKNATEETPGTLPLLWALLLPLTPIWWINKPRHSDS